MSAWGTHTLADIAEALRDGTASARTLLEIAAAAHASDGAMLNAYRVWDGEHARQRADAADKAFKEGRDAGPLQGIPFSAKDLFGISHLDTFAGSPKALPKKWSSEGPVIKSVLEQGAVLTGKTHQVEFAFGGLGTNAHWPIPRNPWDAKDIRVCGGSSSGAGVSLIEGSALVALGSDTAGSVRVPASMTGTVGLKTTAGRWPLEGIVPLSPTLDTPGVLARTVADAALVYEIIDAWCAGRDTCDSPEPADLTSVRLGLCEAHFWDECPGDIAAVTRQALTMAEKAGAAIVDTKLAEVEEAYALFRKGSVVSSELKAFLESELPNWIDTLDPNIAFRMSGATDIDSEEIAERRKRMDEMTKSAGLRFANFDVLVSPTVPITAPKVKDVEDGKAYSAANLRALRNTCIANILGFCSITMPVGLDDAGIPVGLQLMAPGNAEDKLLAVALGLEQRLGTAWERLGPAPLGA